MKPVCSRVRMPLESPHFKVFTRVLPVSPFLSVSVFVEPGLQPEVNSIFGIREYHKVKFSEQAVEKGEYIDFGQSEHNTWASIVRTSLVHTKSLANSRNLRLEILFGIRRTPDELLLNPLERGLEGLVAAEVIVWEPSGILGLVAACPALLGALSFRVLLLGIRQHM